MSGIVKVFMEALGRSFKLLSKFISKRLTHFLTVHILH